jgi:hypothetical protein|tara:strand:+ start:1365 stop:2051 length:687 start_codon:yes stop_codon:yes gene_type:complete
MKNEKEKEKIRVDLKIIKNDLKDISNKIEILKQKKKNLKIKVDINPNLTQVKKNRLKELNTNRLFISLIMSFMYRGELENVHNKPLKISFQERSQEISTSKKIIEYVAHTSIRQGWDSKLPDLFFNYEKRNSKFSKKIDRILNWLITNEHIQKDPNGFYSFQRPEKYGSKELSEKEIKKLKAIENLPAGSKIPVIISTVNRIESKIPIPSSAINLLDIEDYKNKRKDW